MERDYRIFSQRGRAQKSGKTGIKKAGAGYPAPAFRQFNPGNYLVTA
jgi:hypothetical protein